MKKTTIAMGAASLVFAAMPVVGAFAAGSSVTDVVQVTLSEGCTLLSSTTDVENAATSVTNTYTATMSNGQLKSDIGSTGATTAGSNVLSINCNTTDTTKNSWQLTAIGAGEGTTVDVMKPAATAASNAIASGTATEGNTSNWAMKVTGNGVTIQNGFDSFHAVPTTATEVATGSGTKTSAFTMLYQVYISPTQAADTYTGKVTYTLTNPYTTTP